MARQKPREKISPFLGPDWKFNSQNRGWYNPTTGETMSRYEYDHRFVLPSEGYSSYKQKTAEREKAGLPRGPGRGPNLKKISMFHGDTWFVSKTLRDLKGLQKAVEKISTKNPNWGIVIYGTAEAEPGRGVSGEVFVNNRLMANFAVASQMKTISAATLIGRELKNPGKILNPPPYGVIEGKKIKYWFMINKTDLK